MKEKSRNDPALDRRGFFKTMGGGLTAAALMLTPQEQAKAQALSNKRMSGSLRLSILIWGLVFKGLSDARKEWYTSFSSNTQRL